MLAAFMAGMRKSFARESGFATPQYAPIMDVSEIKFEQKMVGVTH
jgi:hypothetical protein